MRKVIVSEFVSLDGVAEAPEKWSGQYWEDGIAQFKHNELFASDALLLGRATYQDFAAAWPSRTGDDYSDRMNSLPKFVVSTTLKGVDWQNSSIIGANVVDKISWLKQEAGQDILVFGSISLAHFLMKQNLIDEYRLLVFPVVLGRGKRLFADGIEAALKLSETKTFSSGVVVLSYQPAR